MLWEYNPCEYWGTVIHIRYVAVEQQRNHRTFTVKAVYIVGACGVSRQDGENKKDVQYSFGMGVAAEGVDYREVRMSKKWYS